MQGRDEPASQPVDERQKNYRSSPSFSQTENSMDSHDGINIISTVPTKKHEPPDNNTTYLSPFNDGPCHEPSPRQRANTDETTRTSLEKTIVIPGWNSHSYDAFDDDDIRISRNYDTLFIERVRTDNDGPDKTKMTQDDDNERNVNVLLFTIPPPPRAAAGVTSSTTPSVYDNSSLLVSTTELATKSGVSHRDGETTTIPRPSSSSRHRSRHHATVVTTRRNDSSATTAAAVTPPFFQSRPLVGAPPTGRRHRSDDDEADSSPRPDAANEDGRRRQQQQQQQQGRERRIRNVVIRIKTDTNDYGSNVDRNYSSRDDDDVAIAGRRGDDDVPSSDDTLSRDDRRHRGYRYRCGTLSRHCSSSRSGGTTGRNETTTTNWGARNRHNLKGANQKTKVHVSALKKVRYPHLLSTTGVRMMPVIDDSEPIVYDRRGLKDDTEEEVERRGGVPLWFHPIQVID
mmetsp:Transcript_423/g.547  ORF Transcript_423/g.547 Transcript_423/m.547 type:complete len:457 (+) Transcript_423:170-1540(+)